MGSKIKQALGSDVRAFAIERGIEVGKRGRFSADLQKEFNDANKGVMRYTPGNVKTVDLKVKVTSSSGKVRTETRAFGLAEVRKAAGANAPKRGPLSSKALAAAAEALSSTPVSTEA